MVAHWATTIFFVRGVEAFEIHDAWFGNRIK
jgi:hypothetical protein